MAAVPSKAEVRWEGNLLQGKGIVKVDSEVFPEQKISWASRTNRSKGTTSPEELIAAAHAGCYAMALSNTLDKEGMPPTRLEISAVVHFEPGVGVTSSDLEVRGVVPGIDQAKFEEMARKGEQGCAVSNAMRNNVKITVMAQLLQA